MTTNRSTGENLVFSLAMLRRRPEKVHQIKNDTFLESLEISTAHVIEGRVHLDISIEISQEDVLVFGQIGSSWSGECRRCIEKVSGKLELSIDEVFRASDGLENGVKFDIEDAFPFKEINGEQVVDLEEVVRDSVLLALPFSPLCSEECLGPDPERFPTQDSIHIEDTDLDSKKDPRWAVLDDLKTDKNFSPEDTVA
ncbi:MAG TPA: DUF177 domain-containing protein [Acidimicrobiales bacterium]|mgnify:CR=1 FL=1|nr:DUF177 domain-containing protein [Acidimicrobiales bacterium]|tara:strand:+ start:1208 stop:1798 length:591 start_codon:yes stop_codon:yes gene_type:complete